MQCAMYESKNNQANNQTNNLLSLSGSIDENLHLQLQGCRPCGCQGCHGLADQVILHISTRRVADYTHQILLAPPDFLTFQQSCPTNSKIPVYI